jgi:SAM-dependent methyltransferase
VYGTLAEVYDWLVPEALLEPAGSVAAFAMVVDELEPGARVLDCACGTGTLAVGLALHGFDVVASDASPAMVERTRALAAQQDAHLTAVACRWEELGAQGWAPFDAVLCVGNSLTHAPGRAGRRAALAAMRCRLRDGGLLAVTSRNWERPREDGEEAVQRGGRPARVRHTWHAGEPPALEVAVSFEDGSVHAERLEYWPFTHAELQEDLRAAGLEPMASTHSADVERYLVTSRANSSNASR